MVPGGINAGRQPRSSQSSVGSAFIGREDDELSIVADDEEFSAFGQCWNAVRGVAPGLIYVLSLVVPQPLPADLTFEFHELRFQDAFISFERNQRYLLGGAVLWAGLMFASTSPLDSRTTALVFVGLVVLISACVYSLNSSFVVGSAGWDARMRLEVVASSLFALVLIGMMFMQHTAQYPIRTEDLEDTDANGESRSVLTPSGEPVLADCAGAFLPAAVLSMCTSVLIPFSPATHAVVQVAIVSAAAIFITAMSSFDVIEC